MDAPAGPLQIDLIKDMGAHLFLWYYEAQREQERQKKRGEVKHNQKESAGELMNELLISIEIAGLRN